MRDIKEVLLYTYFWKEKKVLFSKNEQIDG